MTHLRLVDYFAVLGLLNCHIYPLIDNIYARFIENNHVGGSTYADSATKKFEFIDGYCGAF